jgi:hypothetical protein
MPPINLDALQPRLVSAALFCFGTDFLVPMDAVGGRRVLRKESVSAVACGPRSGWINLRVTLDLYREVPGVMKLGTRSESTAGHFR